MEEIRTYLRFDVRTKKGLHDKVFYEKELRDRCCANPQFYSDITTQLKAMVDIGSDEARELLGNLVYERGSLLLTKMLAANNVGPAYDLLHRYLITDKTDQLYAILKKH